MEWVFWIYWFRRQVLKGVSMYAWDSTRGIELLCDSDLEVKSCGKWVSVDLLIIWVLQVTLTPKSQTINTVSIVSELFSEWLKNVILLIIVSHLDLWWLLGFMHFFVQNTIWGRWSVTHTPCASGICKLLSWKWITAVHVFFHFLLHTTWGPTLGHYFTLIYENSRFWSSVLHQAECRQGTFSRPLSIVPFTVVLPQLLTREF